MPIRKFKNLTLLVFILSFCFLVFGLVTAADEPVKINFKPNYPWSEEKNPAGLVARFYQIALGLAGAAALGVLIYGAILWTVSGAVTGKQDALEWIRGALWGLVLLLGAYLILYTINPDLVKLRDPGELIKSNVPETPLTPTITREILLPQLPSNIEKDCLSCIKLTVNCKNSKSCFANGDLVNKLSRLKTDLQISGILPAYWWVSEAWPPTVTHQNACHSNGTCVDINFTSNQLRTQENINLFIQKADKVGLRAVYEVATKERKEELKRLGVPENNILQVAQITAEHFSVYNK